MNNHKSSSAQDPIDTRYTRVSAHASPPFHESDECSEVQKTAKIVTDEENSSDSVPDLRGDCGDISMGGMDKEREELFANDQQLCLLGNVDEANEVKSTAKLTTDETLEDKAGIGDEIGDVEKEVENFGENGEGNDLDYTSHDEENDSMAPPLKVLFTSANERAVNEIRDAVLSDTVSLFDKGRFFWSSGQFVRKILVLYDKPQYLLVIARQPKNAAEVRGMLETLGDPYIELHALNDLDLVKTFCVAEKLIDLKICKLRLSPLTTPTSMPVLDKSQGEASGHGSLGYQTRACFEVITPKENLLMSFESDDILNSSDSDCDIKASKSVCQITKRWENVISSTIIEAHDCSNTVNDGDTAWRHQLILGTLHSHVVSGNYDFLEKALAGKGSPESPHVYINERDSAGLTALHYACLRRSHKAVKILLAGGADCSMPTIKGGKSPCHLCCEQLDAESLSIILSSSKPKRADPNALDEFQDTPMYVALMRGTSPIDGRSPMKCLRTLEAWGGEILLNNSDENQTEKHPIYLLSSKWDSDGLKVAFHFFQSRFPILGEPSDGYGRSLGAIYCYPIHVVLISLRMKLNKVRSSDKDIAFHENDANSITR